MNIINGFSHGGDYNPEQWFNYPDILEKDIQMFKKANINLVSLGIFSWAFEEPEEGVFDFDWLENIINRLYSEGIYTNLATPSGARPRWMAEQYPEVLRVNAQRVRALYGARHNHCQTSPVYREKTRIINTKLAERFKDNPAVVMWHISNEFGGECHCDYCQSAFREWVKAKYKTIDNLNDQWWTGFWSHSYTSFDQIESPSDRGDNIVHGQNIDWRRFVSDQTIDFMSAEIKALRDAGAKQPCTANMMYDFHDINYYKMAQELDIISWDSYPVWGKADDVRTAADNGFNHDFMRALKHKPFFLMESCPGATNWQSVSKLKRPGIMLNASLQAVAHGSDSVLYFQMRQGRGATEKFHGAVIDHYGEEDSRTYREVCEVGEVLKQIGEIAGADTMVPAAVIYDVENRWALDDSQGPRNCGHHYTDACLKAYRALKNYGLNVDVINMDQSLEGYKIVVAPMLYMFRADIDKKMTAFAQAGGTLVMTYWSGIVNENDRCHLGGTPHNMMEVAGLRSAEIDGLFDYDSNHAEPRDGNALDLTKTYEARNLCELVEVSTAEVLMTYTEDFYAGYPVLTKNRYGKGDVYYICADMEASFYDDVLAKISAEAGLMSIVDNAPSSLEICSREKDGSEYIFVQNYTASPVEFTAPEGAKVLYGEYEGFIKARSTIIFIK